MTTKPNDKLLRVTQMNAIFLDNEIYKTFQDLIQQSTRHLPPGVTAPYEPEINLIVKLALLRNSILRSDSTFGQQLLTIKYTNMSNLRRTLYIIGSCLDYFKTRFELWKPSHNFNNTIFRIHIVLVLLNFINMSIFLRHGSKPLLIERILGLEQVYETGSAPRFVQSKYLARELLWNGFIEILIHVVPLINYHKIRRTIKNYNWFHKKPTYVVLGQRDITVNTKCAHCGEPPILPHHMGCAHVFCYVCLKGNQEADSKYECPICEHRNPNILCDRVAVM